MQSTPDQTSPDTIQYPLIDSHAHVDGFERAGEMDAVLDRAARAGVEGVVAVGGDPESNTSVLRVGAQYASRVRVAIGLGRDCAGEDDLSDWMDALRAQCAEPAVAAIGEVGLDYHYGADTARQQEDLFRAMTRLARDKDLPLVVHSRSAEEATLTVLREHVEERGRTEAAGVLHCFTGDARFAGQLVDLGFHISFSGILTFRNADDIRAAAAAVPEDRLLIETDAPYLAPVPHRGRPNEPAHLVFVARELARVRGVSDAHIARVTADNARRLFRGWRRPTREGRI